MTRVLLVDDEPQLLRALSINLRARAFEVVTGAGALEVASRARPDVVVLDLGLPDMEVLARHVGCLVGQRQLLQEVWGPAYETETNYLRIYLAKLRKKLEPEPSRLRHLLTEPGLGVRLPP